MARPANRRFLISWKSLL